MHQAYHRDAGCTLWSVCAVIQHCPFALFYIIYYSLVRAGFHNVSSMALQPGRLLIKCLFRLIWIADGRGQCGDGCAIHGGGGDAVHDGAEGAAAARRPAARAARAATVDRHPETWRPLCLLHRLCCDSAAHRHQPCNRSASFPSGRTCSFWLFRKYS